MRILAIETSCDETAIAILDASQESNRTEFRVLGNALYTQIEIHRAYGGVFPMLAKREHAKNLTPLLRAALTEARMHTPASFDTKEICKKIGDTLSREFALEEDLLALLSAIEAPPIDAIAVTRGPGLEPALWVGVNFAQALALAWDKPLVAVDHMEGHLLVSLIEGDLTSFSIPSIEVPVLGLLVSGGHTELILMKEWLSYELLGTTRDDAVGEAFDKVARMLGFPYPGGPEISKLAEQAAQEAPKLPRPMIDSPDFDFSYSGLKTAVLYQIRDKKLTDDEKASIAREFEEAAIDVLYAKTSRALEASGAKTLAIGGGVSANQRLRDVFSKKLPKEHPDVTLRIAPPGLTGDNAVMIGIAGFYHAAMKEFSAPGTLTADGNLTLHA